MQRCKVHANDSLRGIKSLILYLCVFTAFVYAFVYLHIPVM